MLVKWYKNRKGTVYYTAKRVEDPLDVPMATLGYSKSFSAKYWCCLQKKVLLKALIEYLTGMLEV